MCPVYWTERANERVRERFPPPRITAADRTMTKKEKDRVLASPSRNSPRRRRSRVKAPPPPQPRASSRAIRKFRFSSGNRGKPLRISIGESHHLRRRFNAPKVRCRNTLLLSRPHLWQRTHFAVQRDSSRECMRTVCTRPNDLNG